MLFSNSIYASVAAVNSAADMGGVLLLVRSNKRSLNTRGGSTLVCAEFWGEELLSESA